MIKSLKSFSFGASSLVLNYRALLLDPWGPERFQNHDLDPQFLNNRRRARLFFITTANY
jgi:hypothetical protein